MSSLVIESGGLSDQLGHWVFPRVLRLHAFLSWDSSDSRDRVSLSCLWGPGLACPADVRVGLICVLIHALPDELLET